MVRVRTPEVAPQHELLSKSDAERLAELMQALASPVRLRILMALRRGPITVTELTERLGLGQTTVSNHLRLLRHLSLVDGDRQGRHIFYSLFDEHVVDLLDDAGGHVIHLPRIGERGSGGPSIYSEGPDSNGCSCTPPVRF